MASIFTPEQETNIKNWFATNPSATDMASQAAKLGFNTEQVAEAYKIGTGYTPTAQQVANFVQSDPGLKNNYTVNPQGMISAISPTPSQPSAAPTGIVSAPTLGNYYGGASAPLKTSIDKWGAATGVSPSSYGSASITPEQTKQLDIVGAYYANPNAQTWGAIGDQYRPYVNQIHDNVKDSTTWTPEYKAAVMDWLKKNSPEEWARASAQLGLTPEQFASGYTVATGSKITPYDVTTNLPPGFSITPSGLIGAGTVNPNPAVTPITAPTIAPVTPATSTGYQATSATAGTAQATPVSVTPEALVENRVRQIVAEDGPLLQMARQRAREQMNARGLLNSSIAEGAEAAAVYQAALQIAQQDANTYAAAAQTNANLGTQVSTSNAGLLTNTNLANAGAVNTAAQFGAGAENEASRFNAGLAEDVAKSNANLDIQASQLNQQNAQTVQNLRSQLYQFDRELAANQSQFTAKQLQDAQIQREQMATQLRQAEMGAATSTANTGTTAGASMYNATTNAGTQQRIAELEANSKNTAGGGAVLQWVNDKVVAIMASDMTQDQKDKAIEMTITRGNEMLPMYGITWKIPISKSPSAPPSAEPTQPIAPSQRDGT